MKTFKIICLLITLASPDFLFGQDNQRSFSEIIQTYYSHKNKDLIEKTIDELNNPKTEFKRFKPIMTGFFGALFSVDTIVRNNFNSNLIKLNNEDFKELFNYLIITNIDSIYAMTPLSPEFNDMNWASFFATGDVKYIDNIISNISLADNRIDRNLFLTGASAKWSLCSNAIQNEQVRKHLEKVKGSNKHIKEILKKEPQEFKLEMINIIKEQKAKGLWMEK